MAILNLVPGLVLATLLLCACESVPVSTRVPLARPDIGWIDRQFRSCGGKDCPLPTRKTLALINLPPTRKDASPAVAETPPAAIPPTSQAEPLPRIIRFEFARSIPTAEGRKALQRLARIASHYPHIELQGRTDDLGSKAHNDRLARRRAEYVRSWLISRGIQTEIAVRAEGSCWYLDPAPTEAARRSNRRVEVRLAGRRDAIPNSKGAQ